ncbi:MAG: DNA primase [Bacteroidales bacterium]|nr:DNA primase [Bacteroidales bacterium]
MIPQETVNLILETARVEEVVGDFVSLKRRGASLVACCPFHNEKTPSFYVTPSKGIYKCFGCGKAGDSVRFLMDYEHMDYPAALRYLAQKYHIEVQEEELSAEEIANRQRRESILLVSEFAHKFFNEQLQTTEGKSVGLAYYHSRGIEDGTIAKWGLGWAPSARSALTDAAIAAGYKPEYLIAAGLTVQHEDGSLADRFRERVMFPIHSLAGRVIAFSGRTLKSDNPAKYVNSPETEIYVKSKALLGIYFAKSEISRQDKCILVEGNVDVITMQQLGVLNVVASCGTSLTVEQVRLIHRFTGNMTIMYDGDSAGIHAAMRGTDLVLPEGMNVRIVLLPEGEDPDSFGRKHSLAEVQDYIAANERDFISFKTDLLLEEAAGDPYKKSGLINDIADTIALIPDAVQRSVYVQETAAKFGMEAQIIFDRIVKTRERAREDAEKAREREARRAARAAEEGFEEMAPIDDVDAPEFLPVRPQETVLENKLLAPLEADILSFLLRYGDKPMKFETDSEYYSPDVVNVTDFIRGAIEEDGSQMQNSVYRKTYDAYVDAYCDGLDQDAIVRRLLGSQDADIVKVASELSFEKYQITVQNFTDSMMSVESWLVNYVPKTILMYAERRVQMKIDFLKDSLAKTTDSAEQLKIMQALVKFQKFQRDLTKKIKK